MASNVDRDRLFARLERKGNGCLEWTGGKDRSGYGAILVGGRQTGTHRLAWVLANGPIPSGMYICHQCDNPACCDIDHLFLGTPSDNARDRERKGRSAPSWNGSKTHCAKGHEFSPENTYIIPKSGWRECRTCKRAQSAIQEARRKARRERQLELVATACR